MKKRDPRLRASAVFRGGYILYYIAMVGFLGCGGQKSLPSKVLATTAVDSELLSWVPLGVDAVLEVEPKRLRESSYFNSVLSSLQGEIDGVRLESLKDSTSLLVASFGVGKLAERLILVQSNSTQKKEGTIVSPGIRAFGSKEKVGEVLVLKYLKNKSMASDSIFMNARQGPKPKGAVASSLRFTSVLDFKARMEVSKKFEWSDVPVSVSVWGDVLDDLAIIGTLISTDNKTAARLNLEIERTLKQLAFSEQFKKMGLQRTLLNAKVQTKGKETKVIVLVSPKRMELLSDALKKTLESE